MRIESISGDIVVGGFVGVVGLSGLGLVLGSWLDSPFDSSLESVLDSCGWTNQTQSLPSSFEPLASTLTPSGQNGRHCSHSMHSSLSIVRGSKYMQPFGQYSRHCWQLVQACGLYCG